MIAMYNQEKNIWPGKKVVQKFFEVLNSYILTKSIKKNEDFSFDFVKWNLKKSYVVTIKVSVYWAKKEGGGILSKVATVNKMIT